MHHNLTSQRKLTITKHNTSPDLIKNRRESASGIHAPVTNLLDRATDSEQTL